MALFYFYGVSVGEGRMNGYIKASELIDGFTKSWFPQYQRERVMSKKKINQLIDVFKNNKPIDSVKINFLGKHELYDAEAILEGKLHFIDGQQRMYGLRDSQNREYKMPVELYLNLPYDEEVRLFHQFNRDGTKLKFGDLVKSTKGIYPDIIRRMVKKKDGPVPIAINSRATGVNLSTLCPLIWLTHKKLNDGLITEHMTGGNNLLVLLGREYDEKQALLVEFAFNNMLKEYANVFGGFDNQATCYKRAFFSACMHIFINLFLQADGKVDFGKFETKVFSFTNLPNNARVKELLIKSDATSVREIYTIFIHRLNYKLRDGHLPSFGEIKVEKEMVERGLLDKNQTFQGKL